MARELGISDTRVHQWCKELVEYAAETFLGSGYQMVLEENCRLEGELERTRQERDILKNSEYLLARSTVKYQVIDRYREAYPVSVSREPLDVSVSGYYAWNKRPISLHKQKDNHLAERIQAAYFVNREVYGSPRLHVKMWEQGIMCSRGRVARLMRGMDLFPRHRTLTTRNDPKAAVTTNLLIVTLQPQ